MSYLDSGFDAFMTRDYSSSYQYTQESADSRFEDGSINYSQLFVGQLSALTAKTGNLTVDETITIGTTGGRIYIDGPNQRIVINDGSDDRVYLGEL